MTFSDFDLLPQSLKALKRQGIHSPTPIQEQAIPHLLESRDLIGQARTGSGKTLAFALPMVEFVDPKKRWVQALVITPTRELANQIVEVVENLGREDGLKVLPVYGGRSIGPQITALQKGVHILVATPGRLVDLIQRKAVRLDKVSYAVVDEADEMLDRGFAKDVEKILSRLGGEHVTALFSATMPDWVHEASRKYLYEPETVVVVPPPEEEPKIEHFVVRVPGDQRMTALRSLLDGEYEGTAIVFGRTKYGVRKLSRKLAGMGYSVDCLQGNMSQNARDRVMKEFRENRLAVLVATNVAARGLDVDHVELVVNYELPENAELLTHRVGRTGRMGREGSAYTLIADTDEKKWKQLKRGFEHPVKMLQWSGEQMAPAKEKAEKKRSSKSSTSKSSRRRRRRRSGGRSRSAKGASVKA